MAEQAYLATRQMIFEQVLAPGARASEAWVARRLGMSRTPVREALARLESEGLLLSGPGRGFIVVELDDNDLADIYRVRAVLEALAASEAATRVSRVDMARLDDLFDAMEAAVGEGEDASLAELNSQFHAVVAAASGNKYLESMLDDIREVFERFRTTALTVPGRRIEAHDEHRQIVEALRHGDAKLAERLASQHVHRALEARRKISSRAQETQGDDVKGRTQ